MTRHEVLPKDVGIRGDVVLEVLVEKNGTVRKVRAVSGDSRLFNASKAALMKWTFIPYFLNGEPVQFLATLTIQFDGKHGSAKLKPESDPILGNRAAPK